MILISHQGQKLADGSDPSSYSGKIIECSWDSEEEVWACMRIRTDKSTPNDWNTYRKVVLITEFYIICYNIIWSQMHLMKLLAAFKKQVMRSIKDNITEEVLLNEIYEIIRLPMYADRIRNDSKAHQHSNSARRR